MTEQSAALSDELQFVLDRLLKWLDGNGHGRLSGSAMRLVAVQFLFNGDYQNFTQEQIRRRYNICNKQLLHQSISDFRRTFHFEDVRFNHGSYAQNRVRAHTPR